MSDEQQFLLTATKEEIERFKERLKEVNDPDIDELSESLTLP